jgi:hypothetical protein
VDFDVSVSVQSPATDTLAVEPDGRVLRDEQGRLVLRPGGHGSLLRNLDALQGDLVYVKNIDNVQPEGRQAAMADWKRALAGLLLRLREQVVAQLDRLRVPAPDEGVLLQVRDFVRRHLHVAAPGPGGPSDLRAWLVDRLDRPLRVCGVVPNAGEPGGGPFWVRGRDGAVTLQIVESAQVDPHDEEQRRIFASSTHFNPVDLVCAVRDAAGRPHDLDRFVDPDAVIVTVKSEGGREVRVLERPGLWNGGMAGWSTVFVEVPLETFSPVKSVMDLLREEHRPGR